MVKHTHAKAFVGTHRLLLNKIFSGFCTIYASVTFATVVARFICLRFSLRFFGIVGGYKLRGMCLHCLWSPYYFFRWQTRTKPYRDHADIVRQPQGYRTIIVLSSKSHDARTRTSRKSQGVGTLTVQLSCNYVHGFKRPSMFIFLFLLNCISKSCDHKSCYEEASVFSWTWSQGMDSVIRLCIF